MKCVRHATPCLMPTLHTPHTHRYTTDTIQVHQKDFIPHILTGTPQIPYRYIRETSYPTYSQVHHRYHTDTSERLHTPLTHTYTTDTIQIHQKDFIPNILTVTPQIPYKYIRETSCPIIHLHHRCHTSETLHTQHTHTTDNTQVHGGGSM